MYITVLSLSPKSMLGMDTTYSETPLVRRGRKRFSQMNWQIAGRSTAVRILFLTWKFSLLVQGDGVRAAWSQLASFRSRDSSVADAERQRLPSNRWICAINGGPGENERTVVQVGVTTGWRLQNRMYPAITRPSNAIEGKRPARDRRRRRPLKPENAYC